MSLFSSLKIEEKKQENLNESVFVFYHLPCNMGVTLGNSLRRIILDYIETIGICGIEIEDKNGPVKSKFVSLEGIKEVAYYLVTNLKEIVFKEEKKIDNIFCLELKVENNSKEEKIVTAADFNLNSNVKIINPNLTLATLSSFGILKLKIYCQKNHNYQSAEKQKKKYFIEQENVIAIDNVFSPVKGEDVNFKIETVLVSLTEKEEEMSLFIRTNGSISPKKVLQEAFLIIEDLVQISSKILK